MSEKPYFKPARAMKTKDMYEFLDQTWNRQDTEREGQGPEGENNTQ
jgi:hypothetical protein